MSDELRRPDELRLPDALAAIEARLAAHPLAPSPLSRDDVLYRAGWAACEAQASAYDRDYRPALGRLRVGRARLLPSLPGRGAIAAWSLASAALAASLAVAATLSIVSLGASEGAINAKPTLATTAAERPADQSPGSRPARRNLTFASFDVMSLVNRRTPTASLWATVEHARRPRWDEPIVPPSETSASTETSPAATAGELLQEMLPGGSSRGRAATSGDASDINHGDEAI